MALDDHDVSLIKGMLLREDRQSDIAAYFGINSGRISEINTGQRSPEVKAAAADKLPPPGPYTINVRSAKHARDTLVALRDLISGALADLEKWESD